VEWAYAEDGPGVGDYLTGHVRLTIAGIYSTPGGRALRGAAHRTPPRRGPDVTVISHRVGVGAAG